MRLLSRLLNAVLTTLKSWIGIAFLMKRYFVLLLIVAFIALCIASSSIRKDVFMFNLHRRMILVLSVYEGLGQFLYGQCTTLSFSRYILLEKLNVNHLRRGIFFSIRWY